MKALHLDLLTTLKLAQDTNTNVKEAAQDFYQEVLFSDISLIERYYVIKGLIQVDREFFLETYETIKEPKTSKTITQILTDIYNYKDKADEQAALDGLGNIDAYIAQIKTVI